MLKYIFLNSCYTLQLPDLNMTQFQENDFSSEWQALSDLRQLSAEAGQEQLDRNGNYFKNKALRVSTNNEFEFIKGCGQVIISGFIFTRVFRII